MGVEGLARVWGMLVMHWIPFVGILSGIGIRAAQNRKTDVSVKPILC